MTEAMQVDQVRTEDSLDFEVVKIVSRKEAPDGIEHLYEVYWRDGDITFEPVANLSGASDALRQFLEKKFPEDALLKVLSALNDSDGEENGPENNIGKEEKLSWLAKWHQKTTRGSTQYWLRKGDDHPDTPSLLKRAVMQEMKATQDDSAQDDTAQNDAPLAPPSVSETAPEDVPSVLFSEEEDTPVDSPLATPDTPGHKIRRRVRVVEETVKMYPHEELYGPDLEQRQNKTMALWRDILSFILLAVPIAVFIFIYYSKQPEAS